MQSGVDAGVGIYRRLFEEHVDVESPERKKSRFEDEDFGFHKTDQSVFAKIPGRPIAYWINSEVAKAFETYPNLSEIADLKQGLKTGDNSRFLRMWPEVSCQNFGNNGRSRPESLEVNKKWLPCLKGGAYRKWYGNHTFAINWEDNGREIKNFTDDEGKLRSRPQNTEYYFRSGITWSKVSSGKASFRLVPEGFVFESNGSMCFPQEGKDAEVIAFLNSHVVEALLKILSPTIDFGEGALGRLPVNDVESNAGEVVKVCVDKSQRDWDSRETSWDFAQHPLAAQQAPTLEAAYEAWKQTATQDFLQLHANEEELNRLFIDLYGLEDELSPRVALDDITILEDELDRTALAELDAERGDLSDDELRARLPFLPEVPIRQFLSYGIGVMLGRYRLGHGGLHIAHPAPSAEELAPYAVPTPLAAPEPSGTATFAIDEDAILPLMGTDSPFSDDAVYRMREILRLVWGEDTLTANLNVINRALSEGASRGYKRPKEQTMEGWLVNEFWDYHKKLYSVNYYGKKPIYWLFASPEGHFQVLVYMHRMTKYTVQQVRQNYLHTWQQYLRGEIDKLAARGEDQRSGPEAKRLDTLRAQAADARAYDALLKAVADQQIAIDLDDGVQANYPKFGEAVAAL